MTGSVALLDLDVGMMLYAIGIAFLECDAVGCLFGLVKADQKRSKEKKGEQ